MPLENIVTVSIMVVGGALLAIIMSGICTNRKLRRHKECCRKEPHVPGSETNKSLRVEIERRVKRVGDIKYEPLLLRPDLPAPKHEQDQYYNRMKALDHLCYLERELSKLPGVSPRMQHESLRGFLLRLTVSAPNPVTGATGAGVLRGLEPRLLHQLCDQHSHARYHPHPFTRHHLTHTHALMLRVLHCGRSGGAKSLGSDDHLKGPSDHDSAIDADPLEMDASSDDEQERQLLRLPQQQYPQQQQPQQHQSFRGQHHQHYYLSSDGNSTQPTSINTSSTINSSSSTSAVPSSSVNAQQSFLSSSNSTGTAGGAGICTINITTTTTSTSINQGTINAAGAVNKTISSGSTSHTAAGPKTSTTTSATNNSGMPTTITTTASSATQKQGYHHSQHHSHNKQPGSAPPPAAAALLEAVGGGCTPGGGATAAAGSSSAAAGGSSRREGKPRKAKKRPGHLRIQDEDEEY